MPIDQVQLEQATQDALDAITPATSDTIYHVATATAPNEFTNFVAAATAAAARAPRRVELVITGDVNVSSALPSDMGNVEVSARPGTLVPTLTLQTGCTGTVPPFAFRNVNLASTSTAAVWPVAQAHTITFDNSWCNSETAAIFDVQTGVFFWAVARNSTLSGAKFWRTNGTATILCTADQSFITATLDGVASGYQLELYNGSAEPAVIPAGASVLRGDSLRPINTAVDVTAGANQAIRVDSTAANRTVTLPDLSNALVKSKFAKGEVVQVAKTVGANLVTVIPSGGGTINGAGSHAMSAADAIVVLQPLDPLPGAEDDWIIVSELPAPAGGSVGLTPGNTEMAANAVSTDGQLATAVTLATANTNGRPMYMVVMATDGSTSPMIRVANGDAQRAGAAFYLSADGGATALAWSAATVGAAIYCNGTKLGAAVLDATDKLDLIF